MRNQIKLLAIFALSLFSAPHAHAADICATSLNFVQNCGFETGDLTDWTVSGTYSGPAYNGLLYGVENYNQYSGNYAAYFGSIGGEITLSQTLTNLIPSDVYTVTVELFNDTTPGNYVNNFSITLGGLTSQPLTQVAAGNYMIYTLRVGASSASPTLSLTSRNDAGFWNVDSIQVIQTGTPEPTALRLCGVSLALLSSYYFVARRRRLADRAA